PHRDVAERATRRQSQLLQRDHLRVDQQVILALYRHLARGEPEDVTSAHRRRAERVDTARSTGDRIVASNALIPPDRQKHREEPAAGDMRRTGVCRLEDQLAAWDRVLDLEPGQRQRLLVGDFDRELDVFTMEGATL